MKRLIILAIAALTMAVTFVAKADNDKPIRFENLPESSRKFILTHFKDIKISFIKEESDFFIWKSYDVFFVDGSKIEFDKKGNWEEVECVKSEIPSAIIPTPISAYTSQHHPEMKIIKISRNNKGYEIKLNNGIEIDFDKKFNMIKYDN